MSVHYLVYELQSDGSVHNWLLAGPQTIPIPDIDLSDRDSLREQLARYCHAEGSGVEEPPQEWEPPFYVHGAAFRWRYTSCLDDHFVDVSSYQRSCCHVRSWAYAEVDCPQAHEVTLALTTYGSADLWLDNQHIHCQDCLDYQRPYTARFKATFHQGHNQILVRFEQVGIGDCPCAMALKIEGLPSEEVKVMLPTIVEDVSRRRALEPVIDAAYLDRGLYRGDDEVIVRWPAHLKTTAPICLRFQDLDERITVEGVTTGKASGSFSLVRGLERPDGLYQVVVMPYPREYYEFNQRVKKRMNLHISHSAHSQRLYGSPDERRREALEHAATRGSGIFAEIAKMEIGRWSRLEMDVIRDAIERVNLCQLGSVLEMVGLLNVAYSYLGSPAFPDTLKDRLRECVLNFRYWLDEPGRDAMCYVSESRQILFHTSQIMAGQLYPDRFFSRAGKTGQWHRETGEQRALSWLHKRATGGFRDWDSSFSFAEDLVALVNLVDGAQNGEIRRLADAVANKIMFTMALNSHLGVYGSVQRRGSASVAKSPQLMPTSSITRLAWGMGAFNEHLAGMVTLATAETYVPPLIIKRIARHLPQEMWSRERHHGQLEEWCDQDTGSWEVNKVTFKTPGYMLSSAQDWRAGQDGRQEHIWQATLGADAVVFVTHPPTLSENPALKPNSWCGNSVLPRVAQWREVLIAIHNLPKNDWLGFTHAYFPVFAFDEHLVRGDWAFARKGDAYLAISASQGLTFVTRGNSAYRELRSYGQHNVWLCHMGRAPRDGSFSEFQERVLALEVTCRGLSVRCSTLRGDVLAFGWEGPLMVNGEEQPITGFKHYDNRYCSVDWPASSMELRLAAQSLRLEFEESGGAGETGG